ncbi:DUF599 domain-containing protein [Puniceibacterium sediminis]|uniref:Uncharacterized membrane protein n=1 Tax=Puniceibacterium sediminis TaxID=1608407 RepID=A0A238VXT4_9RHOB|nr:DUF599 domain-containing protein [Puniceibacterium sediminis]SNR38279.1 Uncharacterized membrane protein [Puniceibacterium sediminis]
MIWSDQLNLFTALDYAALAVLLLGWMGASRIIDHPPKRRPSVSMLMADYRREWLRHFVTREPRIFDSQIIDNMRQGAAFFASASMIAIGGGLALIGNADMLRGVAQDLTLGTAPTIVWEIKLLLMLFFATNGFLKFVWSHRLFGYCAVLMAAVPNDAENPVAYIRAAKSGEINITAARSFNGGLRSVYFGIASAAWLLGAWALAVATVFTLLVILRREFWSASREVLLDGSDREPHTKATRGVDAKGPGKLLG